MKSVGIKPSSKQTEFLTMHFIICHSYFSWSCLQYCLWRVRLYLNIYNIGSCKHLFSFFSMILDLECILEYLLSQSLRKCFHWIIGNLCNFKIPFVVPYCPLRYYGKLGLLLVNCTLYIYCSVIFFGDPLSFDAVRFLAVFFFFGP